MREQICECYRCRHFDRYYVVNDGRYVKTRYDICLKSKSNVEIHDGCDGFDYYIARKKHDRLLLCDCLNVLLAQISAVRQTLDNELDDEDK